MSGYKKSNKPGGDSTDPSTKKLSLKGNCSKCRSQISLYTRYRNGKLNPVPFQMCRKCHWENNTSTKSDNDETAGRAKPPTSMESAITGFIGSLDMIQQSDAIRGSSATANSVRLLPVGDKKPVLLDHHIFSPDGWQRTSTLSHTTISLRMTTCKDDYTKFGATHPKISPKQVDTIVDSGAQSCLWSRRDFLKSGFNCRDLIPVHHTMEAANSAPITIDGAIFLRLSGPS